MVCSKAVLAFRAQSVLMFREQAASVSVSKEPCQAWWVPLALNPASLAASRKAASLRQAIAQQATLGEPQPNPSRSSRRLDPWVWESARSSPTTPVLQQLARQPFPDSSQRLDLAGTPWLNGWTVPWEPSRPSEESSLAQSGTPNSSNPAKEVTLLHGVQRSRWVIEPMGAAESASPAHGPLGRKGPSPSSTRRVSPRGIAAFALSFPVSELLAFDNLGEPQRRPHHPGDRTNQVIAAREELHVLPQR